MNIETKPHHILNRFFELKKQRNEVFSLRALARDLGVSPSYMSRIMTGKKLPAEKSITRLLEVLEMDDVAEKELRVAIAISKHPERTLEMLENSSDSLKKLNVKNPREFKVVQPRSQYLLKHWYYLAILDLTTTTDFVSDINWISGRLGLPPKTVQEAVDLMKSNGHLIEKEGLLKKAEGMIRFPTRKSHPIVRNFHTQMMEKVVRDISKQTSLEAFEKRFVSSSTVAVNPDKVEEARAILNEAFLKALTVISKGECTEVYSLGMQFAPISKELKKV